MKKKFILDKDFFEKPIINSKILLGVDEDKKIIIPEKLDHYFILNNFKVNEPILNYYYKPSAYFLTLERFNSYLKSGYYGPRERLVKPFGIEIFGAYHLIDDLYIKLYDAVNTENVYINNQEITHLSDLIPYFLEYSIGFEEGFNNFINDNVNPYLIVENDKYDFSLKVFEFLNKPSALTGNWLTVSGFTMRGNANNLKNKHIIGGHKNGYKNGCFYRAWSIILSNSIFFEQFFKEMPIVNANKENPYPRVFTSNLGFQKFKNLLNEFGNTNKDLANYSFVYHQMKKDNLIFEDIKQIEYIDCLAFYNIYLDRIKPLSQIGNNDNRLKIYKNT